MMHHHSALFPTLLIIGLSACNTEAPPESSNNGSDREVEVNVTHDVCAYNDDSVPIANSPIDQAESWVVIDSASYAPGSIDVASLPDDDITAAFAVMAFVAPSLTDAFAGFTVIYACTEELYQLNQCNWDLSAEENGGEPLSVSTTVSATNDYLTQVESGFGIDKELQLTFAGTLGDLGNTTVTFYEDGMVSWTRQASRTATGTETVTYTSESTNWVMQESSSCHGTLDFDSNEDGDITTLDANWTFNGQSMSGNLTYFQTGLETPYQLSF